MQLLVESSLFEGPFGPINKNIQVKTCITKEGLDVKFKIDSNLRLRTLKFLKRMCSYKVNNNLNLVGHWDHATFSIPAEPETYWVMEIYEQKKENKTKT